MGDYFARSNAMERTFQKFVSFDNPEIRLAHTLRTQSGISFDAGMTSPFPISAAVRLENTDPFCLPCLNPHNARLKISNFVADFDDYVLAAPNAQGIARFSDQATRLDLKTPVTILVGKFLKNLRLDLKEGEISILHADNAWTIRLRYPNALLRIPEISPVLLENIRVEIRIESQKDDTRFFIQNFSFEIPPLTKHATHSAKPVSVCIGGHLHTARQAGEISLTLTEWRNLKEFLPKRYLKIFAPSLDAKKTSNVLTLALNMNGLEIAGKINELPLFNTPRYSNY